MNNKTARPDPMNYLSLSTVQFHTTNWRKWSKAECHLEMVVHSKPRPGEVEAGALLVQGQLRDAW